MSFTRRLLLISAVLLLTCLMVGWFYGRSLIERQMQQMLQQQLGQPVSLSLSQLGIQGSILHDVRIGTAPDYFQIPELRLAYTPEELWYGRLADLSLQNLALEVRQTPQGWQFVGLPPPQPAAKPAPLAVPFSAAEVERLPLATGQISASTLRLVAPLWQLTLPFALQWQQTPIAQLAITGTTATMTIAPYGAVLTQPQILLQHNAQKNRWDGTWQFDQLTLSGLGDLIPPLSGEGTLQLASTKLPDNPARLSIRGMLRSADRQWQAQFSFEKTLHDQYPPRLQLVQMQLPWQGGSISAADTPLPLDGKSPIKTTLVIKQLPLATLLQELTGKAVQGKGSVSGKLPLTLHPDGRFILQDGVLAADGAGVIALPPDIIPGEQPQLALLRDVLLNLHYEQLSLGLNSAADGKMTAQFNLAGQNPDLQNGRPVKMNVNLSGAVLDLITSNIKIFTAPRQLLTPSAHDKK